ncbi:MAG: amidohydrolase [Bacteroidia bacterium]|nr:amidohydrolase [Bacteroidia bacterium]
MRTVLIPLFVILLLACNTPKTTVDTIITNAKVHTMQSEQSIEEAIAIKDGKIIAVGSNKEINEKYKANQTIDAQQKELYPGFTDCHGHILSLAKQRINVNLIGTASYDEMITRLKENQTLNNPEIIIGRGWDQSIWGEKELPDNKRLNEAFPNIPVALTRIDGHAMLINNAMMKLMHIDKHSKISGGVYLKKDGELTGIIIDNAVDELNKKLPKPNKNVLEKYFLQVQEDLLALGLTHIHDAGLDEFSRDFLIDLANAKKLKINIYGMLFPSPDNIAFAKNNGIYRNGKLTIRSFKMLADGSLGSRSACLLEPYADDKQNFGIIVTSQNELKEKFEQAKSIGYQLNVHCIGDSANRVVLNLVNSLFNKDKNHRWRIEHAQVISKPDFQLFKQSGLIPSVQPTHATTDQRWAENRLGEERLTTEAYAYNSLLNERGIVLFGTDFPIEDFNPFATIYAAVKRKDTKNFPSDGFLSDESVPLYTALQAITKWAAYGSFDEANYGTIEANKNADFVILNNPLNVSESYQSNAAWMTIINGEIVYQKK